MDFIKAQNPALVFAVVLILFAIIELLAIKLWAEIKTAWDMSFYYGEFLGAGIIYTLFLFLLYCALQAGTFTCAFWIMKQL